MIVTVLTNRGSGGATRLSQALQLALPQLRVGRATMASRRRSRGIRYVVNWGCAQEPVNIAQRELILSNSFAAVATCRDKAATFHYLSNENVPCVEWTLRRDNAALEAWLGLDGKVVVRHSTTGHSGHGIEIVRRGQEIPAAPLYTRYFKKDAEYRVHVAFDNIILIQQKRKRNGFEQEGNAGLIRTHANGWVFTTNNRTCDERGYTGALSELALNAARAVGASHCAVDILTKHTAAGQNSVVVEINSQPGIEAGSTLEAYTNAFANHIRSKL